MTMIFGHRGLSSMYPENTMAAFKGAYDDGMDGIELDVHMTKDGEIVVIHDFFMDRTTDGIGYIKDLKFKDIKKHSAGKWFNEKFSLEKVSSLQEIFEYFKDNNFKINVEIKAGYRFYENIEEKIINNIYKYYKKENIIISSFDHYSLLKCKEIDSTLETGALYEAALFNPWTYMKSIKVDYIHPQYLTLTDEVIEDSKKEGYKINTYTVDDVDAIKRLISKDINIIFTNKTYGG